MLQPGCLVATLLLSVAPVVRTSRLDTEQGTSTNPIENLDIRQVAYFDLHLGSGPAEACAEATLRRQNHSLALEGSLCSHRFSDKDLHREFVASTMGKQSAFYFKTSDMCGAGLFTRPALDCTRTEAAALQAVRRAALFSDGVELPDRGFGVELELVARDPEHFQGPKRAAQSLAFTLGRHQAACSGASVKDRQQNCLPLVKLCFQEKTGEHSSKHPTCISHADCPMAKYCRKPHATSFHKHKQAYCKPREACDSEKSVDGTCPVDPELWSWTTDPSVRVLDAHEALDAGVATSQVESETTGVGFELISPPPPHVLSGRRGILSMMEVLGTLTSLGVQAGPSSGMHVHVNVGRPSSMRAEAAAPGADLTSAQILNVWAHYARFQLVINEMLQDSRIGNSYAYPLLFLDHATVQVSGSAVQFLERRDALQKRKFAMSMKAVVDIYTRLQARVQSKGDIPRDHDFCDTVNTHLYGDQYPCRARYPKARYFQLNLVPMNRLGTIEFRAFPSTTDPDRALRWVTFVLRFVEHYKDDCRFLASSPTDTWQGSVEQLRQAQLEASMEDLSQELTMDLSYWRTKAHLGDNQICLASTQHAVHEDSTQDGQAKTEFEEAIQNGFESGELTTQVIVAPAVDPDDE